MEALAGTRHHRMHPAEMLGLRRRDLVFPGDGFGHVKALFVHLRDPKTARFAQRQHGRIDDEFAIRIIKSIFGSFARDSFLYPASAHTFRRQWDAIMSRLGIPHRAASQGATPGVLTGGGATHLYQQTENLQMIAWRGGWAKLRTLEHYLQEVAAQMMLSELSAVDRGRIASFDASCEGVLALVCLPRDGAEQC